MPDQNPKFKRVPRPESIDTLIKYLKSSEVVTEVERVNNQLIRVKRSDRPTITAFLTNIYIVGEADVVEILSEYKDNDCIVTMSVWNSYTGRAESVCKKQNIGLFVFKEFLGAVYYTGKNFLDYISPDDRRHS